jgi:hypothetical protein
METIAFYGVIQTGDSDLAARVLAEWAGAPLDVKVRLGGAEMVHERDSSSFYCHAAPDEPVHLLEGRLAGTLADAGASLARLSALFASRAVTTRLDYVRVNERGEETSPEFSVG